jgi:hypothetical protein
MPVRNSILLGTLGRYADRFHQYQLPRTLETLYYIEHLNWDGWFAYDVFTRHGDPAEAITATFQIVEDLKGSAGPSGLATIVPRAL